MQGFWNLIGKAGQGPGKEFQYDIGEKVASSFDSKSVWTLHHGKKRINGDPVSVFICDSKVNSPDELLLAKTAHKRLKTLRHPNIIKYLDGYESETLVYVVTEPIVPLCSFLDGEDGRNSSLITWGLHQVANGLSFLINNGNLSHENVNMFSIFVGLDGEWKLGGVEYVHPSNMDPVAKLPYLSRYDPPEGRDSKNAQKWSADSWGLGCLIWEIYNGELQKASDLKSINKIPKPLVIHYCDLVSANPKNRTNPKVFLEKITKKGQFLNNTFIQANLFLQEIQIKDQNEQKEFFQSLDKSLDDFPKQFCIHKVLPQLLNAFEYGSSGSSVLSPLFKVGLLLDDAAYQSKIVPCIIKLFSSNDRATRIQLLQQMEKFVKHLQPSIVDSQIFGCVSTGFGDTLPAMREQTVKAMLLLAPKLSEKTISNQLLRYFAKLQMDEQPGIRTNTTICLGKIAQYISQPTRQKVLIPAFTRSLRDPFPPARTSGIMAIAATKEYYSMPDIACKVLPGLCACTVDPDKSVRDNAFKVVKMFLTNLEKYSNDPDSALNNPETAEREAKEQLGSTWTGWAVSSFTSRFYQSSTQNNNKQEVTETAPSASSEDVTTQKQEARSGNVDEKKQKVTQQVHVHTKKDDSDVSDYGDNWEDEWTDPAKLNEDYSTHNDSDSDYGDWGQDGEWGADDVWGSKGKTKTKKTSAKKISSKDNTSSDQSVADVLGMDSGGVDFLTGEQLPQQKAKPFQKIEKKSTKTSATNGWDADDDEWDNDVSLDAATTKNTQNTKGSGWDDNNDKWGDNTADGWDVGTSDNWDHNVDNSNTKSEQELKKEKRKEELAKKREERKQQRELANMERKTKSGSGAMKLGAVKKHTSS